MRYRAIGSWGLSKQLPDNWLLDSALILTLRPFLILFGDGTWSGINSSSDKTEIDVDTLIKTFMSQDIPSRLCEELGRMLYGRIGRREGYNSKSIWSLI
jgi:hypothetical protein